MSKWIGYAVSVNCGEPLGCYQGTILETDGNTITLTKAFRNGFPYPKSQVTLNAADIKDLKIIETRPEPAEPTHSTVAVTKTNKKGNKATVCENLQANPSSSGNQSSSCGNNNKCVSGRVSGPGLARSKPIDIQGTKSTSKNNNHSGSYGTAGGGAGSTPKCRGGVGGGGGGGGSDRARRRNEACFGDAAEPALDDDFDFEGNLALFDKQALWERMRHAPRPDLLRQADDAAKFRHDENVLGAGGGGGGVGGAGEALRPIALPEHERGPVEYVSDEGVVVPAASARLRRRVWAALERSGLADGAGVLLARAAADVALRLAGGSRRLDPRNAHQAPRALALVGVHRTGAAGALAARLLASHGVRAAVVAPPAHEVSAAGAAGEPLSRELAALRLAGVPTLPEAGGDPDVVLVALHDWQAGGGEAGEAGEAGVTWAARARGAVVALEPPSAGWAGAGLSARAAVVCALPPPLSPALGRVYLADVAPPPALLAELGVSYRPPFGALSVLALHPADD